MAKPKNSLITMRKPVTIATDDEAASMEAIWLSMLECLRSIDAKLGALSSPKSYRQVMTEKRHETLRRLASATGLGPTWVNAARLRNILIGAISPPPGCDDLVSKLQDDVDTPRSERGIYRVICIATDSTDTP